MNRKICVGIVAQVDAGKTTLCESILFLSLAIRKKGRVDDRDSFFDFNLSEKQHGITLYSKEARISRNDADIFIIDTPGHRDFSSEVERVIPVLDVILFVVNACELNKQQNIFLFRQIEKWGKPILVFASKMDMGRVSCEEALSLLSASYSDKCVQYENGSFVGEAAATIDEIFLEAYMEGSQIPAGHAEACILRRSVYPVIFGSGLYGDGVKEMLDLISALALPAAEASEQGGKCAYVYKIDRDAKGMRQTHVKILSGRYRARDEVSYDHLGEKTVEKINEIRQISGSRYQLCPEAEAGDLVAFTGPSFLTPGQYTDSGPDLSGGYEPSVNPIEYSLYCDDSVSSESFLSALRQLEEEDPSLAVSASGSDKCVYIHLKGDLQKDILRETMEKRFRMPVLFGAEHVEYYETISDTVYGNGHYEPLKHYAEVRVKLSPLARGSGIVYESKCPEDVLPSNWQNLILNGIRSFSLRGVLIGAPLTDVKITLLSGKYHIKHTEGGDFREAVIRAIRQGLMKAHSVLLEPFASFTIVCASGLSGKLLSDLEQAGLKPDRHTFSDDGLLHLSGTGPLITVDALRKQYLSAYGDAVFFEYADTGLSDCPVSEKIIGEKGYDPQADLEQSPDSVFCSHGAGHVVKWDQVDGNMHTDPVEPKTGKASSRYSISEKEFTEILKKYSLIAETPSISHRKEETLPVISGYFTGLPALYLIDGSNLLHAYCTDKSGDAVPENAPVSLMQDKLVSELVNFIMYSGVSAKIVFDGFSSSSPAEGDNFIQDKLSILYSGNESADVVLERLAASVGPDYKCKMVTSDRMVQISALHSGITRISSREFLMEMTSALSRMREQIRGKQSSLSASVAEMQKP